MSTERTLTTAQKAAITADAIRQVVLVYADFPTGEIFLSNSQVHIDYGDTRWLGMSDLLSVSKFKENNDLATKSYTIGLSGLNATLLSEFLNQDWQGNRIQIALGLCDEDWQLIGAPIVVFDGIMDSDNISIDPSGITIEVECTHIFSDLLRKKNWSYTPEDHKALYPAVTETGFDSIHNSEELELEWGK